MKTTPYLLAAPDLGALDTLARRQDPAVLWPIGSQSLVALWLDHAVRLGHRHVVIHAPDRPAALRAVLGSGAFWSLQLEIVGTPAPAEATVMMGLPGEPEPAVPTNATELLLWWKGLNTRWLAGRQAGAVSLDRSPEAGGWVGPHAKIHPTAKLIAPYWIGAGAEIGPGCEVGPFALIGAGSWLEGDISVADSLVLADTFLGRHLEVRGKVVAGDVLLDPRAGVRVQLVDKFIASALTRPPAGVPFLDRLIAVVLWPIAQILALGAGPATTQQVRLPGGRSLNLRSRPTGPLLARRADWLAAVITGQLRLIGVLPRSMAADLPDESRRLLEAAIPGAFALSDLHGVHRATDQDEVAHALYQAAVPQTNHLVAKNFFRLCWLRPEPTN